jgi:hypothetical protein
MPEKPVGSERAAGMADLAPMDTMLGHLDNGRSG